MKIASLHLRAYGPFTGTVLDLEAGGAGLQVVFGQNEAGKSSALRAVRALFFGIPAQTADNFVHDYPDLRVGAVLLGEDGRRHAVMRRKGNKNVLFQFNEKTAEEQTDRALPPDYVLQLVPGVDEELFGTLFGLSHDALRHGGAALVSGEGDLGNTLFAAGAGLADVKGILQGLDDEARSLFLSAGHKQAVNAALREYEAGRKAYREAMVRPQDWKELDGKAQESYGEVTRMEAEQHRLGAELAKKRRLRDLRPVAQTRQALIAMLEQTKDVVKLPEDARARVTAARERMAAAAEQIAEANARIAENAAALESILVSQVHLDAGEEIEALHHAGAVAREERTRLLTLAVKLQRETAEVERLASELGVDRDEAGRLVPSSAVVTRLKTLARLLTQVLSSRASAQVNGERGQEKLGVAKRSLAAISVPGDISGLEAVLDSLQRQGDLEASATAKAAKAREIGEDVKRLCAALEHPDEKTLFALALPQRASIDESKNASSDIDARKAQFLAEEKSIQSDLALRRKEIGLLEAGGTVVTGESLKALREHRDHIWAGIRQAYVERSAAASQVSEKLGVQRALPEEYELQVQAADGQADLLRADTKRATQYAEHEKRIQEMEARLRRIAEDKAKLVSEREAWERGWAEVLEPLGLKPRSPDALLEWLRGHEKAVQRAAERDAAVSEQAALDAAIANGLSALKSAYTPASMTAPALPALSALMAHARAQLKLAQKRNEEITDFKKDVASAEREIAAAALEMKKLDERKAKLTGEAASDLEVAGLAVNALPEEIDVRLDVLTHLASALRTVEQTQADISTSQAVWDRFVADVQTLAKRLSLVKPASPDESLAVASSAYVQLTAARKAQLQREARQSAISADTQKRAGETAKEEAARARLTELVTAAGCGDEAHLDEAVEASEKRRQCEKDLEKLNAGLLQYSEQEQSTLLGAAAAISDIDALQAELAELEATLESMDGELKGARGVAAQAQAALDRIDGSSQAASARDLMEHHAAAMQRSAAHYARTRLAHQLLGIAIRTYQERSQGPLIKRASEWFAHITEGRYSRLVVDFDEDRQVLLAVRSDGERLGMGALSEGTADQLYLALRLAAIEVRLETSHAMPLILDDALLAFDDNRAIAALKALAQLGERNQVILFTHHAHVMELAIKNLKSGHYATHELELPAISA